MQAQGPQISFPIALYVKLDCKEENKKCVFVGSPRVRYERFLEVDIV